MDAIIPALAWAHGEEPPPRRWAVEGLVPAGRITLLSGDGGVGKTLLAQQMATCIALGVPFLGRAVDRGRVLALYGEDEDDELQRRQAAINGALFAEMADLHNTVMLPGVAHDIVLWSKAGRPTGFFESIATDAMAMAAKLVVIDNAAAVFAANEIDRVEVTSFLRALEREVAHASGAAVLLLAHPSRAGLASGDGLSGSTAWRNAVRSQLNLKTDGSEGDRRTLTNQKTNYGPFGGKMTLEWRAGVFALVDPEADPEVADAGAVAEVVAAIARLLQRGEPLSPSANQATFAPRVLLREGRLSPALRKRGAAEAAYRRALDSGAVAVEEVRSGGHKVKRLRVVAQRPELSEGVL
jgi:RecA-family ATPase